MNSNDYITIQGWMINDLQLKGNDLIIYAVIYGFSKDGESSFHGSLQYLADCVNGTKQGVQKNLKNLIDLGLISKTEVVRNNVKYCEYSCIVCNSVAHPIQLSCINKLEDKKDGILSNDNITKPESSPVDDCSDKLYSKDDMKNDFLGSRSKSSIKASRKHSLYDKCLIEIDNYTQDVILHDMLVRYLKLRLAMKDKPLYGLNQWRALLNKLDEVYMSDTSVSYEQIVTQSIEQGYASFYPVKKSSASGNRKRDVFSEYGETNCDKKEEEYVDRKF